MSPLLLTTPPKRLAKASLERFAFFVAAPLVNLVCPLLLRAAL